MADDRCTPLSQAQERFTTIAETGSEVELVVYPREGHVPLERAHALDAIGRTRAWFDEHLQMSSDGLAEGPLVIGTELEAAARNNAEWCDIMCRLHGQAGVYRDSAWTVPRRSPPFYPDAITLDETTGVEAVLRGVDTSEGCSVKDSFACLDLASEGFHILFEARWVYLAVDVAPSESPADMSWDPVRDAIGLQAWEAAWNEDDISPGLFRPAMLDRDDVLALAGSTGGSIVAGAIVNRSATVTGVSNVFSVTGDREAAWRGVVAALAQQGWSLPMVGYANGDDLDAARRVGFEPLGPLRVWMKGDSLAPTSGAG